MSREASHDGPAYDTLGAATSNGWHPATDPGSPDADDIADMVERFEKDNAATSVSVASSWAAVDLGPYVRGEVARPAPSIGLARSDGLRLIYPGREHAAISEMESGKSWFGVAAVAAELVAGHPAVYVHFEEADPGDTVARLLALGVPASVILTKLRFVGPDSPVTPAALDGLTNPAPRLVVLDGVVEAMALHGQENREETGAAAYRRRLVKPFTRVGAAVLSLDHVVKDVERRGRTAIGSVHKGNGLSGSLIVLENHDPFGRGARGRSSVFVTKDRPGHLRRHGQPTRTPGKTYLGELIVDDTQSQSPDLELRFWAPNPSDADQDEKAPTPEDQVLTAIERILSDGGRANLRAVRAASGLRKTATDDAIERLLLDHRLIEKAGPRGARLFALPEGERAP